jgi:hypothetical protein
MKCVICRSDAHRYACDDCVEDVRRRLREIELFADLLGTSTMLEPVRGSAGRRAPGFGSRPPVRLDVIVMNDRRSKTEPPPLDKDRGIGLDECSNPWPILGTLRVLADHIRDTRGDESPRTPTLETEIVYLLGKVDWAANHPGIAELASQIRHLHTQVRSAAHDAPPKPIGECLTVGCDGKVYPPPSRRDSTRCSQCGRHYTGLGLVKLQLAQEG